MKIKGTQFIKFFIVFFVGIIISFVSANRSNDQTGRNDTYAYKGHYECGINKDSPFECKKELGSSKLEYAYEIFPFVIGQVFGNSSFFYYKLILALIINLSILFGVFYLSGKSTLPVILLLCDYRFYAYSSNIIRHGLALSFALLSLYAFIYRKNIRSNLLSVIAFLFHNSSFIFAIKFRRKFDIKLLLLIFITTLLLVSSLTPIIQSNRQLLFLLNEKIVTYSENYGAKEIMYPIHYLYVFIFGAIVYWKSSNEKFIIYYNCLFTLLVFSLLFSAIGVADRIIAFMPPFIYLLMYLIYKHFLPLFISKSKPIWQLMYYGIFTFLMMSVCIMNFDMIRLHINSL